MELLESQGFAYEHMIDIFDGGPSIEAYLEEIETVRTARFRDVVIGKEATSGQKTLIAAPEIRNFACIQGFAALDGDIITLSEDQALALGVSKGDKVLTSPLKGRTS